MRIYSFFSYLMFVLINCLMVLNAFGATEIYWTEVSNFQSLGRVDVDGSNKIAITVDPASTLASGRGLAIDKAGGKIYWANGCSGAVPCQTIARSNLDGSQSEILVDVKALNGTKGTFPQAVALDLIAGKIYWADQIDKIQRSNLDGSNPETILSGKSYKGIALDLIDEKIYWAEPILNRIERSNLDGTVVESLVFNLDNPQWVAVDPVNGKIYWTDSNNISSNPFVRIARIQRANLDGSEPEMLINTGLVTEPNDSFFQGIAVDPSLGKIFWADSTQGKILKADLDGANIEEILSGLPNPIGVALDATPIAPVLLCSGFESPMANYPVKAKKNRVFPLKMEMFDDGGFELTDAEITARPVVQVMFTSADGGDAVDVSAEALSSGHGTDGNQFDFTDDGIWQFNLKSRNYTAEGTYLVTAVSGDESEYTIDPSCVTSFVIE